MITFVQKGDFRNTEKLFERVLEGFKLGELDKYGIWGVQALSAATPRDTGKTAESWKYSIKREKGQTSIYWSNSNVNKNVNIAVILQYGHGTRNGGYVQGRDYINPAMRKVFDDIAEAAWKEVVNR